MTWPEWMPRWLRGGAPESEVRRAPEAPAPSHRRMSGEYLALHKYLDDRYASTVVLTFQQIEALLGFTLPPIAKSDPAWWTAATAATDVRYQDAWKLADRTAAPNLPARIIVFQRGS